MLIINLISIVAWMAIVPFKSTNVSSVHYARVSGTVFLLCLILTAVEIVSELGQIELYHSLFNYSSFSIIIDLLLFVVAGLVLVWFTPHGSAELRSIKPEYSLILMFSILGASMIISAQDMISIYVALELQSFGLYILACLRTDRPGSTHASLKYFLLGAISSAFILLGISIIYQEVGSTSFENISSFLQSVTSSRNIITLGVLSMLCGFIFKVSAAPFHSWFSDVIQGVPTYTSMVIINLPKISIFTFIFNFYSHLAVTIVGTAQDFLIIVTLISLIMGTVAGLVQTKLKRLLAFSTISHVGFILIGLTVSSEVSLSAMIFYLLQYTLTVVLTFLVLIAYENSIRFSDSQDGMVNNITDLQGTGQYYKLLTFTLVLCLFSIAGIPPITGFYAKLSILNSSIIVQINIVFITAIICSILSAAYYFKVIKVLMFDRPNYNNFSSVNLKPVHSYTIAALTGFVCLFILDPIFILNCTELVALSLYIL